ncbi:MAG: alkylhydroperoxidase domain protein [Corynebacterium sp.]|nr:alkylhydroperoxidase domain protein [Corynebacterium sp.]
MADIINLLAGLEPTHPVARLRTRRAAAQANAQASFEALLEPDPHSPLTSAAFSAAERYAVAAYVAGVTASAPTAAEFYADLLADEPATFSHTALTAATRAVVADLAAHPGPYAGGRFAVHSPALFGARLAAALDWAHLLTFHPKDASPAAVGHLHAAGWSVQDIVSLSQLIAFLSFQLRVIAGLSVLAGTGTGVMPAAELAQERDGGVVQFTDLPDWEPAAQTLVPTVVAPTGFVTHSLGWKPWVRPLAKEDFTEVHTAALIQPQRIDSEYFRLLAHDPAALEARTKTDLDIFYNTDGGLGRAERELSATVVSRFNGCEFCASVHQQRSKDEGGDAEGIDKLLTHGIGGDLGSSLWNVLQEASVALTTTPISFGVEHVQALRAEGLDEMSILDVIYSAAFFNWANRLMLTLGAPDVPKRFR